MLEPIKVDLLTEQVSGFTMAWFYFSLQPI